MLLTATSPDKYNVHTYCWKKTKVNATEVYKLKVPGTIELDPPSLNNITGLPDHLGTL